MTEAAEVTDLAAALTIADRATSKWRAKPHHDDVNQAARIAAWRTFAAGLRAPGAVYGSARSAAIDELRRLTGRGAARRLRRHLSIDHATWVEPVRPDPDPLSPSQLYGLTGRHAVLADAIAAGELGQDIAAVLGVHPSRVSQLRLELRSAIQRSQRPGGHP